MSTAAPLQPPAASGDPSRGTPRRRRPRARVQDAPTPSAQPAHPAPGTQPDAAHVPARGAQPDAAHVPARGAQQDAAHVPARGGRSGRGRGRGRGQGHAGGAGDARPAPTPAPATPAAAPEATPNIPNTSSRRGNARGRGGFPAQARGRGRGARAGGPGGRHFGGQLSGADANAPDLQPDAPEFRPGQPVAPRHLVPANVHTHAHAHTHTHRPQGPKSLAQDIATRTHEDIDNGHYECAICYDKLKKKSKVWSCRTCWTVFHLACIKQWSTKEGAAAARQQAPDGQLPPPRQWRCPGCNLPKDVLPQNFACWCEKEVDPRPVAGLPPYSCGQTCSRPRLVPKKCPHPCPSTCHAGPCAPCGQMGPTQFCFCGQKSVTRRCIETDYENGWSCGDICGEMMSCGEHKCPQPCHEGSCGVCEVRIPARCYCGQVEKDILCFDRGEKLMSRQSHAAEDGSVTVERWIAMFACANPCSRLFDCGKHRCEKPCHQQDADAAHCPRSPDLVTHCPCGKTPLSDISAKARQTCEDPIPNCSKPCHKQLDCGHECKQHCHQGECPPCLQTISIACRCGRTSSSSVCHQGRIEPPQCMRICRVSLNCGRHECGERCCQGEKKASERQSKRRKPQPIDAAPRRPEEGYEAEHICTRSCGRQLKCGNPDHRCEELCHKGACGTCREAIFDELSCHCGRTTIQPPLPCGTKPPPCRYNCGRPKSCGHPQVPHNCHQDEESCPKCPFLMTKPCLCGKNSIKNQPCWLTEVRCGQICGQKLKCGTHICQKQCHRPGECEEPCKQACGKELDVCGHPCVAPCHFPLPCKEDKPCQHKTFVTCECQRIKQEAKCNASKTSDGNLKKTLKCDEECARLERNRKLQLALNIDPAHQDEHIPYSTDTLRMYVENSTWAAAQEKEFRLFAANPAEKRKRFKPMPAHQRAFIHSIAEDFGLDSEGMDPEPHRHVAIFKTPRFVLAPMKTLAECARIRQVQRLGSATPAAVPTPAAAIPLRPKQNNFTTVGDPYNAFIIANPRFGLTTEEVTTVVKNVSSTTSLPLELEIHFLPSEEVALKPPLMTRATMLDRDLQTRLEAMKPALAQAITQGQLGKLQLARLDFSLNVLRRESDDGPGAGWSQVVAAKGVPNRKVERREPIGTTGRFTVLSLSRKKKDKEQVVDDWETAELEEEEKEKGESSGSASVGGGAESEGAVESPVGGPAESPVEGVIESVTESAAEVATEAPVEVATEVPVEAAPEEPAQSAIKIPTTVTYGRWADMDDEDDD